MQLQLHEFLLRERQLLSLVKNVGDNNVTIGGAADYEIGICLPAMTCHVVVLGYVLNYCYWSNRLQFVIAFHSKKNQGTIRT